jgi:Domain of unknown function (DUF4303)
MNPLRIDRYYAALLKAIKASFAAIKDHYAGQRMYGYALVMGDLRDYTMAAAHSEEGLDAVVGRYVKSGYKARKGDARALLRDMLRWNCDDGWFHLTDPDPFDAANELLKEAAEDSGAFYEGGGSDLAEQLFLAALHESYHRGVFGKDQSVTVLLYTGEDSDKEVRRWVKWANPPAVVERFLREWKAGDRAAGLIDSADD